MDRECSPPLEMLKKMEIQWMRSALHYLGHVSCSIGGECSPLPLSMSTKKEVLQIGSAPYVGRPLIRF
jgi:hypothetical protein